MSLLTFSTGETPPASKLNSLAQQNVVVCTSSTRPGHVEGMNIYETDTNHMYWSNGSAWKVHPRGLLTKRTIANTGPGITSSWTAVNNSSIVWGGYTEQRYAYESDIALSCNTVGSYASVRVIRNGAQIDLIRDVYIGSVSFNHPLHMRVIDTGSNGTDTWSMEVKFNTGIGAVTGGTDVSLSHIGLASA